jgi:hypothetical protein
MRSEEMSIYIDYNWPHNLKNKISFIYEIGGNVDIYRLELAS